MPPAMTLTNSYDKPLDVEQSLESASAEAQTSDSLNTQDRKVPCKREREISLEATTPQAVDSDEEEDQPEKKSASGSLKPQTKKNRVHEMDSTEEVLEDYMSSSSGSESTPPSTSPPHETKMRQISQGVEDIDMKRRSAGSLRSDSDESLPRIATPPSFEVEDSQLDETDTSRASDSLAASTVPSTSAKPSLRPSRQASESDSEPEQDKGLKRKLKDRGASLEKDETVVVKSKRDSVDSVTGMTKRPREDGDKDENPRETKRPSPPPPERVASAAGPAKRSREDRDKDNNAPEIKRTSPPPPQEVDSAVGATKRPREDRDNDDNPRETKRPSPPPPEDATKEKGKQIKRDGKAPALTPKPSTEALVPTRPGTPKAESNFAAPKLNGFMAYASSASPFSAVKGTNIFAAKATVPASPLPSGRTSPTLPPSSLSSSTSSSTGTAVSSISKTPSTIPVFASPAAQTPAKRTGFEAFASAVSPFASIARSKSPAFGSTTSMGLRRNKSPARHTPVSASGSSNPFSSYASGGAHGFAVPAPKRARAASPNSDKDKDSTVNILDGPRKIIDSEDEDEDERKVSFGERLRAEKDEENEQDDDDERTGKVEALSEQELTTGEEEEETVQQARGKLFVLSEQSQWKERGTGTLRLNVRRDDGGGARLVMRKEAVFSVMLNITLFKGMSCFLAQDPRYLRFSAIEDGKTTHYNLRVQNAKVAQDLLDSINANVPDV